MNKKAILMKNVLGIIVAVIGLLIIAGGIYALYNNLKYLALSFL